jgi:lipoprotein-anchoring transpeptidase ErfK/SrfK
MHRSLFFAIMALIASFSWSSTRYGETLCQASDYFCLKVKSGESWESLFPNDETKDIVRRLNRTNLPLRSGMIIAIPKNIDRLTIYDVSPFPRHIKADGEKTIYINQKKLAWGAYDKAGELVWWGPISSGADHCVGCATPTGSYRIINKQDINCISTTFPRRRAGESGGAEMPYCMHFFRGYALHGSDEVPGYRASHGCIRLFTEDARWLNEEFVDLSDSDQKGTRVVIDSLN